jgi:hypothetical protein
MAEGVASPRIIIAVDAVQPQLEKHVCTNGVVARLVLCGLAKLDQRSAEASTKSPIHKGESQRVKARYGIVADKGVEIRTSPLGNWVARRESSDVRVEIALSRSGGEQCRRRENQVRSSCRFHGSPAFAGMMSIETGRPVNAEAQAPHKPVQAKVFDVTRTSGTSGFSNCLRGTTGLSPPPHNTGGNRQRHQTDGNHGRDVGNHAPALNRARRNEIRPPVSLPNKGDQRKRESVDSDAGSWLIFQERPGPDPQRQPKDQEQA